MRNARHRKRAVLCRGGITNGREEIYVEYSQDESRRRGGEPRLFPGEPVGKQAQGAHGGVRKEVRQGRSLRVPRVHRRERDRYEACARRSRKTGLQRALCVSRELRSRDLRNDARKGVLRADECARHVLRGGGGEHHGPLRFPRRRVLRHAEREL